MNATIHLSDGRQLGWAEFGDPAGRPLVYFHGFPGSRLEAELADEPAAAGGWRIIGVDRPGMGASTYQPGRRLIDWPADVAALADHLGLDRFAVLGVSGGGPYALACAGRIPERLAWVGTAGGLGPPQMPQPTRGMGLHARLLYPLTRVAFPLAGVLYRLYAAWLRHRPDRFVAHLATRVPAVDRQVLLQPRVGYVLARSFHEAVRPGAAGGIRELWLYTRSWDFRPADITIPVTLWHGEQDSIVPVAMGRYLAAAIPGCRSRFFPADGHYSLPVNHLSDLLADADATGRWT